MESLEPVRRPSHDLDLVMNLCERTIVLDEGRVAADGEARELFRDDALLAQCRLEKPFSMQGCPVCGVVRRIA